MPVKIRLMRIGAKKRPFYRVVAVDEQKKRTGAYIEALGTYNPLTNPKEILLKNDRIDYWTKNGAVLSDGFLRIIGKAPQRNPRKPKKEKVSDQSTALRSESSGSKTISNQPAEASTETPVIEEPAVEKVEETPSETNNEQKTTDTEQS